MRASRLALPLLAFLFGFIGLAVALFTVLRPGEGGPGASGVGGPFRLTGTNGQAVTEKDLQGAPSLVFFGFTHCPDVCPTTLQEITQVYDALGPKGDRLKSYFVSVDPERDTPESMREYLSSFDRRIVGLTGSPPDVEAMEKVYRVYARKVPLDGSSYTMDHTALVYLMDSRGRFVGSFNLDRPPAESAKEIERFL